ncbi:MAG TPA: hypothetical protein VIY48_12530 [Candidatus Paceibacterota bacterium]
MSEPANSLAPSSNEPDNPQELRDLGSPVVLWGKNTAQSAETALYDFRPVADEDSGDDSPDPKASPVRASALSEIYETVKIPLIGSEQSPESPAPAEKDSGQPSPNENGTPTSSEPTSAGKTEQSAPEPKT